MSARAPGLSGTLLFDYTLTLRVKLEALIPGRGSQVDFGALQAVTYFISANR